MEWALYVPVVRVFIPSDLWLLVGFGYLPVLSIKRAKVRLQHFTTTSQIHIYIVHRPLLPPSFLVTSLSHRMRSSSPVALRKSRRLAPLPDAVTGDPAQLALPAGCDLVAGTFVVFRWQDQPCLLQVNLTLYCWGGKRSGAFEMLLEEQGLTHSLQIHHISSKLVTDEQWSWLRQVFVVVRRLFDAAEVCDTVGKVHWLNVIECRFVYELLRRQCYQYQRNIYPEASVLITHLKRYGIELEAWFSPGDDEPRTPVGERSSSTSPTTSPASKASGTGASESTAELGEREWLSDLHLANMMFLLLYGQLALPLEQRDVFQLIYPMTDPLFINMLEHAEAGSLVMQAKLGHGVSIVFINPNNNHWRLIILDGLQRQVVLFDPLGTRLPAVITRAIHSFFGESFRVVDLELHLQSESWNCGVWALYMASRYIAAAANYYGAREPSLGEEEGGSRMDLSTLMHSEGSGDGSYVILNDTSSSEDRRVNRVFASELRAGYSRLLMEAAAAGRLLYSSDDIVEPLQPEAATTPHSKESSHIIRAGTARSATRHRRFLDRTLSDQMWIDLTEETGSTATTEAEEAMEQSLDDLCDHYIEFRDDNVNNPVAASLKYSLPAKHQSDVLKGQIEQFRAYRRERFSLFRRGPLVEETTIASNISALLRFLGYLFYEQESALHGAPLDMSVFALDDINRLVLGYVEWLERRRGSRRQDDVFQPVSCATVANYINALVSIVKFQLRADVAQRDRLLEQLRNLRSQAESYSMTSKRFQKVHPEWCSWPDLQLAREKCREAFDRSTGTVHEDDDNDTSPRGEQQRRRAHLLQLRELCLMGLFTICPPPRCSVIRLLEWDKTLVQDEDQRWMLDLTDLSHAATRHKTHKRKGAMQLPLSAMLSTYLSRLRKASPADGGAVFASGVTPASSSLSALMSSTSFTSFVKQTFRKYTPDGRAPNPSLLRSIFTTWLYSLRYDTEDTFLQQIKASSAKWKAHSEHVAATVYNKEAVYQKKEFALLLRFCERYAQRYAYDRQGEEGEEAESGDDVPTLSAESLPTRGARAVARSPHNKKKRPVELTEQVHEYVVDELTDIRVNAQGEKQVLVQWEGYKRRTWEPFHSIRQQLPEMLAELEAAMASDDDDDHSRAGDSPSLTAAHREFLKDYIAAHHIDDRYRWTADRIIVLQHAVASAVPPLEGRLKQLKRWIMALARDGGA